MGLQDRMGAIGRFFVGEKDGGQDVKPTDKQRLEYDQQGEREKADLICRQGEEDRSLKWAAQVASEAIDVRLNRPLPAKEPSIQSFIQSCPF